MSSRVFAVVISVLLALGLVLPGCGETATPTPTKAAAVPTAAATSAPGAATATTVAKPVASPTASVKMGGQITVLQASDWLKGQYDVHYGGMTGYAMFGGMIYESLLTHDLETFETIPRLAERWELAPDARSITLYLRKGVKWHNVPPVNGREFTADDVKWNFDRVKASKPPVDMAGFLGPVVETLVIDRYTVKINFSQPFSSILWWLADSGFGMYPRELQEQYGDKQAKAAIGTGAFMLKSYEQNVEMTLVKNPDYYLPGLPRLDTIKIVIIADPAARLAALRAGQGDTLGLNQMEVESIRQTNPDIKLVRGPGSPYGLRLNATKKPFNDVRVRQALHLALDRQEMIKVLAYGQGQIAGFYGPTTGPYMRPLAELEKMPGLRQPKDADIAEAKRLLAEAGYGSGLAVESAMVNQQQFVTSNELIGQQVSKIGITWNMKFYDMAALSAAVLQAPSTYQAAFMSGSTRGDPDVSGFYATNSGANVAGWGSKTLDDLLLKGQLESDQTKRVSIYRQVEDELFKLMNSVPLFSSFGYLALNPAIQDYRYNDYITFGFNCELFKYAWRSVAK